VSDHTPKVTRVQNGIEPRKYISGASVDPTNVASLGRNLLLDNKLRLLFGSSSNKHENIQ
jgi:hypothetical protein